MKLVFTKDGKFHLGCSVVPPEYANTEKYDVAELTNGESFDHRYAYTCVNGVAVRGELLPVNTEEIERMEAEFLATQYQRDRANAYPSFAEQFDLLYHGGYDAWRAAVDAVKQQFPKPQGA